MQIPFSLGEDHTLPEIFSLPDAEIRIYHDFLAAGDAKDVYRQLLQQTPWQQDSLNFGGKSVPIPRLQAWYGDSKSHYAYSGLALAPLPWTPLLATIRKQVEMTCETPFNSVLLNYYRDGTDSVAWHSDDEKELGPDPLIASLSLGTTRRFELKHRVRKMPKTTCNLDHGSLLVMGSGMQKNWSHQVPKQPEITGGRINLTFRYIVNNTP